MPTNHQIIITREEKKEKLWLLAKKSVPLQPLFASCDGGLGKKLNFRVTHFFNYERD